MSVKKEEAFRKVWEFDQALRKEFGTMICGIDEAGRGPLAGPVVAAAVIFPADVAIGPFFDSKKLSVNERDKAFAVLTDQAIDIGVGIVDHHVIDRYNILQATHMAMKKALSELTHTPDLVVVDGMTLRDLPYSQRKIVHGDALSQSIAAASIVAKVTRDRLMRKYDEHYPLYGFSRHMGYGTKEHLRALELYGPCPIHRMTFAPVRALQKDSAELWRKSVDGRKMKGRLGEDLAIEYLEGLGYRCIERNWRVRRGEVDAVMQDGDTLVFVEVRSRQGDTEAVSFSWTADSIDERKRKRLRLLAEWYGRPPELTGIEGVRIDVVLVHLPMPGGEPKLVHYPGVL